MATTDRTKMNRIREIAERLVQENRKHEPGLRAAFWFKCVDEVRIAEVMDDVPDSRDEQMTAYHFRQKANGTHPVPIAISLIHPDELERRTPPPAGWGSWDKAVKITMPDEADEVAG